MVTFTFKVSTIRMEMLIMPIIFNAILFALEIYSDIVLFTVILGCPPTSLQEMK